MFIDVLDGISRKSKSGLAANELYRVLRHDKHTEAIQRRMLVEGIIAGRVALASRLAGLPPKFARVSLSNKSSKQEFRRITLVVPCKFGSLSQR